MFFYLCRILFIVLLSTTFSACSSIRYLTQGATGHLALISQRQPISNALVSKSISKKNKKLLTETKNILQFAHQNLNLPNNGSYHSFVDVKREAVTWNIVATKKYSISPIQSCFPFSGCVSYLVFFNKERATNEAKLYRQLGHDVHIIASPAYSTLGVFKDPVVSTMFRGGISSTAEVIFHELAHQRLFRKNGSAFNEAFASAVGEEGTRLWLKQQRPQFLKNYNDHVKKRWQFFNLLFKTSEELKSFYARKLISEKTLSVGKKRIFSRLKTHYANLKKSWNGDARFDNWFTKHPLNNAKLATIGVYYKLVPEFSKKLKELDYDFERFYHYYETKQDLKIKP